MDRDGASSSAESHLRRTRVVLTPSVSAITTAQSEHHAAPTATCSHEQVFIIGIASLCSLGRAPRSGTTTYMGTSVTPSPDYRKEIPLTYIRLSVYVLLNE